MIKKQVLGYMIFSVSCVGILAHVIPTNIAYANAEWGRFVYEMFQTCLFVIVAMIEMVLLADGTS